MSSLVLYIPKWLDKSGVRERMAQEIEPPQQQIYDTENHQEQPFLLSKKKRRKPRIHIVATVAFAIVMLLVVFSVLYFMTVGLTPGGACCPPQGSFSKIEVIGSTSAIATFEKFENSDPRPAHLVVVLVKDDTSEGQYAFPNNRDGVTLNVEHGTNLGTITYLDFQDNEWVNKGDRLLLTDLDSGSDYTLRLYWAPTGDIMDEKDFDTF